MSASDHYEEQGELAERKLHAQSMGRSNRGKKRAFKPRRKELRRVTGLSPTAINSIRSQVDDLSKGEAEKNQKLFSHLISDCPSHPAAFWKLIKASSQKFRLKVHRHQRLKAAITAYSVYVHMCSSKLLLENHIAEIRMVVDQPMPRSTDYLDLVLQLVCDYQYFDDGGETKLDVAALSRDAQAIRWLIRSRVRPWEVLRFQKANRGGLDKWSRLMSKALAQDKDEVVCRSLEAQAQEKPADWDGDKSAHSDPSGPAPFSLNDVAKFISQNYRLEPGETLILEFSGEAIEPRSRLIRAGKFPSRLPPGLTRARLAKVWKNLVLQDDPPA